MSGKRCGLDWIKGDGPREDGTATLTLHAKDGRELELEVCAHCLARLIAKLTLMGSDLLRVEQQYKHQRQRRN